VALSGTVSLGLLVIGGIARLVAGPGVTVGRHAVPGGLPAGAVAGMVLALLLGRALWVLATTIRRRRQVRRLVPDAGPGTFTLVDDHAVYAVATPGRRRTRGRVIASSGLWAALAPEERAVVLAHEHAHLDGRHQLHLALAHLAVALNPLLAPVRGALAYALERCADEAAVRRVGDRGLVARAVGHAALAAHRRPPAVGTVDRVVGLDPAHALGVATGPVPRRVAALLSPVGIGQPRWAVLRSPDLWLTLATICLVAMGVALVAAGVLHAAVDLGDVHGARDLPHLLR
jgi:hypothetical protein